MKCKSCLDQMKFRQKTNQRDCYLRWNEICMKCPAKWIASQTKSRRNALLQTKRIGSQISSNKFHWYWKSYMRLFLEIQEKPRETSKVIHVQSKIKLKSNLVFRIILTVTFWYHYHSENCRVKEKKKKTVGFICTHPLPSGL